MKVYKYDINNALTYIIEEEEGPEKISDYEDVGTAYGLTLDCSYPPPPPASYEDSDFVGFSELPLQIFEAYGEGVKLGIITHKGCEEDTVVEDITPYLWEVVST